MYNLPTIFISLLSFTGAVIYYIYKLNHTGIIISIILSVIIFKIILYFVFENRARLNTVKKNKQPRMFNGCLAVVYEYLPIACYLLFTVFCFILLFQAQTIQAIVSPWQILPNYFFIFYTIATAVLMIIILKKSENQKIGNNIIILLISLHYFLSFSIVVIVYKLGYGFDPFIHQAAMNMINKIGEIEPKQFYYSGQYSLIIILHQITQIPLVLLDKLLVPALTAAFLPAALFQFLQKYFENKKINFLLILVLLILPFSIFIISVPQNLAYLFLILTILFGLTCSNILELIIVYLFALTALFIHPIAGIPSLLFVLAITIYHSDARKIKKYFYILIFSISVVILPSAFYFSGKITNIFKLSKKYFDFALPNFIIPNQENFIFNFIYLYGLNIKIIISILIIIGLSIAYYFKKQCKIFFICFGILISLLLSYLISKQMILNFLINYEQNNYSNRILILAVIFALPFIITVLYYLLDKILQQNKIIKTSMLSFLIILITTSLYLSYPRFDVYYNSRGYSISQHDINTVRWIENDTRGKKYIVLANQQVSAAALREFGFERYLQVEETLGKDSVSAKIYFYPIPTGGKLYQYYLDMVYKKPSRETMIKAMEFAKVNQAYLILNKYWWAFPKITAEAKLEADEWKKFEDEKIYVFKYTRYR